MKFLFLNIFFIIAFSCYFFINQERVAAPHTNQSAKIIEDDGITTIVSNLNVPIEIIWGPDNHIWIAEHRGVISKMDPKTGKKEELLKLTDIWQSRTAGLLGMALHSDMKNFPYVFLAYTIQKDKKYLMRLVRYTSEKDSLINPKILMEIPAANGHNGSRLLVHQGLVYWATGDALSLTDSQTPTTPNGKILRMTVDGAAPPDNPIKGNLVWAWGFRNIQGMVFSKTGQLYTSEHGDATDDEINLISKARNYGWPNIEGFAESVAETSYKGLHSTVDPLKAWTPTIAPAGLDYYDYNKIPALKNSLLLVTLKGKSFRVLKLDKEGKKILSEQVYFENKFGRIRDLCVSPEGDVYLATSNRDWNPVSGFPIATDDRIIKISKLDPSNPHNMLSSMPLGSKAASLYQQYCASCHKENGLGVKGTFPSLLSSLIVVNNPKEFIKKVLSGSKGPATINGVTYDAQMPAFAFLKDEELLDIMTYVRSLGSNHAIPFKPELIEEVRTSLNK